MHGSHQVERVRVKNAAMFVQSSLEQVWEALMTTSWLTWPGIVGATRTIHPVANCSRRTREL